MALIGISSICQTSDSHSSLNLSTNWSINDHTSMSEKERQDQPVYGILHDHHLVLVPGPLFPLPMRQTLVMKLHFLSPVTTDTKKCFTFCFFLRVTLTPSTDTMMPTFFFLMFFALNSYWKRSKNYGVRTQQMTRSCPELHRRQRDNSHLPHS